MGQGFLPRLPHRLILRTKKNKYADSTTVLDELVAPPVKQIILCELPLTCCPCTIEASLFDSTTQEAITEISDANETSEQRYLFLSPPLKPSKVTVK